MHGKPFQRIISRSLSRKFSIKSDHFDGSPLNQNNLIGGRLRDSYYPFRKVNMSN